MKRTFESENIRKTKLFDAWIEYLRTIHSEFGEVASEEIYEGLATVSDLSRNRIGFHLDDDRKLRHIPIAPAISEQSCRLDTMFVTLGLREGRWWPLDVISIGSVIFGRRNEGHITYNPLYVNGMSNSTSLH
jgi:hypothetical protein